MLFLDKSVVLSLTEKEEKIGIVRNDIQYVDTWLRFTYHRVRQQIQYTYTSFTLYDIFARKTIDIHIYLCQRGERKKENELLKLLYECEYKGVNYLRCDASYLRRRPLMPLDRSERRPLRTLTVAFACPVGCRAPCGASVSRSRPARPRLMINWSRLGRTARSSEAKCVSRNDTRLFEYRC